MHPVSEGGTNGSGDDQPLGPVVAAARPRPSWWSSIRRRAQPLLCAVGAHWPERREPVAGSQGRLETVVCKRCGSHRMRLHPDE